MKSTRVKIFFVALFLVGGLIFALNHKAASSRPAFRKNWDRPSPSSSNMERSAKSAPKRKSLPQCILIGVKKAGTRALFEMLSLNSGVKLSDQDVHFFDKDSNYEKGLKWYLKHMAFTTPGQVSIERTAGYFVSNKAPKRIYRMSSTVKLLLIVREPVERLVSDYLHERVTRHQFDKDYPPIESMLVKNGTLNLQYPALRRSLYYLHMQKWLQYFSLNSIHIIDGDALIQSPLPELQKVEKFLELKPEINSSNLYFNQTKGFYCMKDQGQERCLNESKGRTHPTVDPDILRKVQEFFKEPNRKFMELVGQKFNWTTSVSVA